MVADAGVGKGEIELSINILPANAEILFAHMQPERLQGSDQGDDLLPGIWHK